MDCRVVVEAAVQVYDVEAPDEAVRIAISKTGNLLNPDLNYVEISPGTNECRHCGEEREPAFVAADEALVRLELEMEVFNVEREEHAERIARKEIGQRLPDVPLDVLHVEKSDDSADEASGSGTGDAVEREDGDTEADDIEAGEESGETATGDEPDETDETDASDDVDDEVLPGFDELLERESGSNSD